VRSLVVRTLPQMFCSIFIREQQPTLEPLAGLFQGFDQEEDLDGHCVVQIRIVVEGAVAV